MRKFLVILSMIACDDDRSVDIKVGADTRVKVHTVGRYKETPAEVSVEITQATVQIPVLVPMPMPYVPLAEKLDAK